MNDSFIIAGTDEAGRGPLAGPVIAAAAIVAKEQRELLLAAGLRDSKKLSAKRREELFALIRGSGVVWRAQACGAAVIDRVNILQASLWCMKRSIEKLPIKPSLILVDGNRNIPELGIPQKTIIGGDDVVPAIAAASVIAKVLRDRVMEIMDKVYPDYQFAKHKGYPSALHKSLIARWGPSPIHRLSFRGVKTEC
ncbi:ribonuclease HII [Synergistes jonesii]|uniref:ribonuclease HII n=1 Tax=Synergistes jonesii TaxID=2754 RepID=UPI00242C36E9|nr:ribonuclease HII [Synergistes jonesii]